jgi:hypothetical protein
MVGVQLLLIHSQTREVLWYGQVVYPQYFKHKGVTEETARKATEQIPMGRSVGEVGSR